VIDIVVCQNDTMAMGARKAFEGIDDVAPARKILGAALRWV